MSDNMDNLATALAKAQGEMQNAQLNKVNPHFKSKYADLAAIRDATIPALSKNGLSIVQYTRLQDGALILRTRLLHVSGEFLESEYPLPMAVDKPQQMGSAYTYGKRYSWAAMCGISADDDDDGNEGNKLAGGNGAPKVAMPNDPAPEGAYKGPKKLMELKSALKDFAADLDACDSRSELDGLLASSAELLERCKRDLPLWYSNERGDGMWDRVARRQKDLDQLLILGA